MNEPLHITPAERVALLLIAAGLTDAEAGKALKLHPKTINKHRVALLKKSGARNTVALIVQLIRSGDLDVYAVSLIPRPKKKKMGKSGKRS